MYRHALTLVFALVTSAGCGTLDVRSSYSEGVDFSQIDTFAWVSPRTLIAGPSIAADLARAEDILKTETTRVLPEKGIRYVDDPAEADVLIAFVLESTDELQTNQFPSDARDPRTWGAPQLDQVDRRSSSRATLTIDILDAARREAVWHGWATEAVEPAAPENPVLLRRAVQSILETFPPNPG